MKQTECSETSAYKIQTPGNYPEENIQHTEHSEGLKSRTFVLKEYTHSLKLWRSVIWHNVVWYTDLSKTLVLINQTTQCHT